MPAVIEEAEVQHEAVSQRRSLTGVALIVALGVAAALQLLPAIGSAAQGESDFTRQWTVAQYVRARVNPYPVALAALEARYGRFAPSGPVHLRDKPIYSIPRSGPHADTDARLGPPEATYPPTTSVVLAFTVGYLSLETARMVWLIFSCVVAALVCIELFRAASIRPRSWLAALAVAGMLAWPPVSSAIERQQFSLLVLWAVLVAARIESERPGAAALLYSIAILKPSLSLPYLLSPLAAKRWKVLGVLAAIQAALMSAAAVTLGAGPFPLILDWVRVARQFRQSLYGTQEYINMFRLDGSAADLLIPAGIFAAALVLIRHIPRSEVLAFVSVLAAFVGYHGGYDFVVVLVPGAVFINRLSQSRPARDMRSALAVCAIIVLGIALTHAAVSGASPGARAVRWSGRAAMITLLAASIASVRKGTASDAAATGQLAGVAR